MEPITVGPFKPDIPRLRSLSIKVGLQNRAPALGVLLLAMSIVLLALHIPLWLIAVAVLIEVLLIVGATLYKAWRLYKPDRMPGAFRDTTVTLNEKTLTWADDAGTNATVPLGDFKSAKAVDGFLIMMVKTKSAFFYMPISEFKSKADLDRAYDILVNAKLLKEKPKAN